MDALRTTTAISPADGVGVTVQCRLQFRSWKWLLGPFQLAAAQFEVLRHSSAHAFDRVRLIGLVQLYWRINYEIDTIVLFCLVLV